MKVKDLMDYITTLQDTRYGLEQTAKNYPDKSYERIIMNSARAYLSDYVKILESLEIQDSNFDIQDNRLRKKI